MGALFVEAAVADPWTPEMIEILRRAVEIDGVPYSTAASRIGRGVTRNAAIAKAKRLGLVQSTGSKDRNVRHARMRRTVSERKNPKKQSGNGFRLPGFGSQKAPTAPPHPFVAKADPVTAPKHMRLVELEKCHCKWPYGSGPFTFCGHEKPATDQIPYCDAHMALSAGPAVVRERKKTPPDVYVPVNNRVPA